MDGEARDDFFNSGKSGGRPAGMIFCPVPPLADLP
jgi:hypothetical protein